MKGSSNLRKILHFGCSLSIILMYVTLASLLIYLFLRRFRVVHKFVKFIFLAVNAVFFALDLFTVYYYHIRFNILMLNIALMTNFREGSEFLQMYLLNKSFWLFVLAIIALIFIARKVWQIAFKPGKLILCLLIIFLFAGIFSSVREISMGNGRKRDITNYLGFTRFCCMTARYYNASREYNKVLSEPNAVITKNLRSIPYIIFILGESAARHHMSIYGYDLPTSPNLEKRQIYIFNDVVCAEPHTVASVRKMFTFHNNELPGPWYNYMNLFSILKAAGYYNIWLSNQEVYIGLDAINFYVNICDERHFIEFKSYWDGGSAYDDSLLPILDEKLTHSREKNFYMLHLNGSHVAYKNRYPAEYAKFTAKDEISGYSGITESEKITRAEYDNTILYNDYVLNEIIKRFEDKNAIIIYTSDHGQEVYDLISSAGHGWFQTRNVAEVPFLIWTSRKFCESYPDLDARIKSSVDRPYMTDDVIHTILDIAGIETPGYDPAKSVINAKFDSSRPRINKDYIYTKEKGLIEVQ
ncbi:MAG: sulfatase-like hydrolase/transferase [Synergistaceae bacterium]|nr:sulfatase-like hydrolase/transferase [Synergistaceae bacterium]